MAVKIQIRRGTKAGLPTLAPGEYGLAIDTGELFVGGESGNLQVAVLGSDGKVPESQLPEQTNLIDHMNNKQNPHAVTAAQIGAAPAYTYSTTDLTAGTSPLETGKLHFVYEA